MIFDKELELATDFALSSISFGNAAYTRSPAIDLGIGTTGLGVEQTPDIGESGDLDLVVYCTEDFATAGSPAVTIDLHSSAASNMGTPSTHHTVVLDKTPNAGDVLARLPLAKETILRYLNLNVAVATADFTGGKISAWISRRSETTKYDA
jgi:hypothetical protein